MAPAFSSDIPITALAVDPVSPTTLYTALYGVLKSTDSGGNWTPNNTGMPETYIYTLKIDPRKPTTFLAGTRSGVYKSTDGGENWSAANTGLSDTEVLSLVMDPENPTTLFAGTSGNVFKSTDGGGNWSASSGGGK